MIPDDLGPAGRALWAAVCDDFELSASERHLLLSACRQADDIALLEAALVESGPIVAGASGQPRLSMVVAELRQGRLALAKLVQALALPMDEPDLSPVSQRARAAANSRWRRDRQLRAARDAAHGEAV